MSLAIEARLLALEKECRELRSQVAAAQHGAEALARELHQKIGELSTQGFDSEHPLRIPPMPRDLVPAKPRKGYAGARKQGKGSPDPKSEAAPTS